MSAVLLVEDDEDIRVLLSTLLVTLASDVRTCADGEQALAVIEVEGPDAPKPDLVVLDVTLPGELDGLEVARRVAARPGPAPRVLLLSARARTEDVHDGLAAGADAYVTKPFQVPDLLAQVASLLERGPRPAAGAG